MILDIFGLYLFIKINILVIIIVFFFKNDGDIKIWIVYRLLV